MANEDNFAFGSLFDQFDDQKILGNPEHNPPWDNEEIRIVFGDSPSRFKPGQWVDRIDEILNIINAQWFLARVSVCRTWEQESWVLSGIRNELDIVLLA